MIQVLLEWELDILTSVVPKQLHQAGVEVRGQLYSNLGVNSAGRGEDMVECTDHTPCCLT